MAEAEAPATSATLYAVHKHVASRCGDVSAAFMACKAADQNPEVCLKQGAAVTSCVVKLCVPGGRKRSAATAWAIFAPRVAAKRLAPAVATAARFMRAVSALHRALRRASYRWRAAALRGGLGAGRGCGSRWVCVRPLRVG
jgi:hypothetical protein